VLAVRNTRKQCLPLSKAACAASANITTNTSRYSDFSAQQPLFKSSGGGAAGNNPIALLPLSVALMAVFLMTMVTRFRMI
jgi:hypothetical protein